eukprot:4494620-Pyramimonas_sp.AAC.1
MPQSSHVPAGPRRPTPQSQDRPWTINQASWSTSTEPHPPKIWAGGWNGPAAVVKMSAQQVT